MIKERDNYHMAFKFKHPISQSKTLLQWLGLSFCLTSLGGCFMDGTSTWEGTSNEGYFMPTSPDDYNTTMYTESDNATFEYYHRNSADDGTYNDQPRVVVPQSYHMNGINNSPTTAKDGDKEWVERQNPGGYTIQIQKDSKPAAVANTLQQMPKNERSVEVRSHSGSYLGLHGNYQSREAAQSQLDKLPADVKNQATIKPWGTVQKEVEN
jgi:septal ring-binding cell division protein DamX